MTFTTIVLTCACVTLGAVGTLTWLAWRDLKRATAKATHLTSSGNLANPVAKVENLSTWCIARTVLTNERAIKGRPLGMRESTWIVQRHFRAYENRAIDYEDAYELAQGWAESLGDVLADDCTAADAKELADAEAARSVDADELDTDPSIWPLVQPMIPKEPESTRMDERGIPVESAIATAPEPSYRSVDWGKTDSYSPPAPSYSPPPPPAYEPPSRSYDSSPSYDSGSSSSSYDSSSSSSSDSGSSGGGSWD